MANSSSLPALPEKATIIFDLDGTLVDSNRDLIPTLNIVTEPEGLPPIAFKDVGYIVGQGARMMIKRAFEFHERPLDEPTLDRLFQNFLAVYETRLTLETRPFENAVDVLDALIAQGWILGICTNKSERMAIKLIEELGLSDRFAAICGGDTFDFKKPDPQHIVETVLKADGDPLATIMVGDSKSDIYGAQRGDIPVIGVTFGYTDIPIEELKPTAIINHFNEFREAVEDIRSAHNW